MRGKKSRSNTKIVQTMAAQDNSETSQSSQSYIGNVQNYFANNSSVVVPRFQAPALPPHFISRPEVMGKLEEWALSNSSSSNGVLTITALRGLGGIGKSTLAAALAHDKKIRSHFKDGVLWVTLGQEPDILSLLSGWIKALGDYKFQPTSIQEATPHLRALLSDKTALLVVDDAWSIAHVAPFLAGTSMSRVLVTTRVVEVVGATRYDLDVMSEDQALALISHQLSRSWSNSQEINQAKTLAKAVGFLPLALELATVQIVAGLSWDNLIAELKAEIANLARLATLDAEDITDEDVRKRYSLQASFYISIKRLPKIKQNYFAWFGVLPEDVNLTHYMTATLWNISQQESNDLLMYFYSKALLMLGAKLDDGTISYRLHDLVHDFSRHRLIEPQTPSNQSSLPGLGISLVDANKTFLLHYHTLLNPSIGLKRRFLCCR